MTQLMILRFHFLHRVVGDSSDFYLYRISYMWYAPLGVFVSIIVGLALSNLFRLVTKQVSHEVNPDLFTPPVASRIRRRLAAAEKSGRPNQGFEASEPNGIQMK